MAQSASYDLLGPLLFFIPRIKKDLNVSFALQRVPSSLPPRLAPFSSLSSWGKRLFQVINIIHI